ncbi:hypothetical protein QR680_007603 [Steinernema hermaphroditum]|uniref:Uncharacterized protein n=1 Tax=Steinernema hermaphroditum TaxID=289476 RepID=A0AA39M680_9BILA|nr:hypothetical protein QR680_007603 [Steinernema hermaphroditum]
MLSWTAVGVSAFVGTLSIVFGVYIYGTHSGALQSYSTVIQGPKAVAINATYERQANPTEVVSTLNKYHHDLIAALAFRPYNDLSVDVYGTIMMIYNIASTVGDVRPMQVNENLLTFVIYASITMIAFYLMVAILSHHLIRFLRHVFGEFTLTIAKEEGLMVREIRPFIKKICSSTPTTIA